MNIETYRKETPGVSNVIHFNNAGSSLMPKPVFDTVSSYLDHELHWGGYETADKFRKELNHFYVNISSLINASPEEIAFLESATHAWDMVFFSIPFTKGDKILTTRIEYASNYIAYLQIRERTGAEIIPVASNEQGEIDLEALEAEIKKGGVKLVSITHIPTNGGIVNPAEGVGDICERYGIWFLLDACQSAGQYPLDVKKLKCHFLSATGRKYMRGPRGTGFLYVNRAVIDQISPWSLDLHSAEWVGPEKYEVRTDARKFEKWESNLGAKIGLSEAARYCEEAGIENIWMRVQILGARLREGLSQIPGTEVLDMGRLKSGIVTYRSDQLKASKIKYMLASENINTSMAVASGTLLDMQERSIDTAVRASVHYYNTEEEIEKFLNIMTKLTGNKA
jgi:selenocysteine lyase/cysteine desulfurase